MELVEQLLKEDPMLVYEYDDIRQTGLIWATKRNYTELAELLVFARSRVNFKDIVGRTALMLAVENRNERLIRFLLCFHANPITKNYSGKGAIDLVEDQTHFGLLKRAACMRAGLSFISGEEMRFRFWKREVLSVFDLERRLGPYHDKILLLKNS